MFSFRSFIVSGLAFRSFIHFEFIFVYGVRKCSSFILLQVVDQFFPLKRLSFLGEKNLVHASLCIPDCCLRINSYKWNYRIKVYAHFLSF